MIYACNFFPRGPNMLAITKIVLEARDYDFLWTNHAKTNFQCLQEYLVPIEKDCKHIWSLSDSWLQPYLFPFFIKIASLFGPFHENYCNHMWSIPILECNTLSRNTEMSMVKYCTQLWFEPWTDFIVKWGTSYSATLLCRIFRFENRSSNMQKT